jgi:arsenate reductase (thioredoxin)
MYNVLFLCTHNSARSVIAECIMNRLGQGKFHGFSAGSAPRGEIHPYALDLLRHNNYDTGGLRSKSWLEFAREGAAEMDFIFTVCDDAAGEVCPIWPGQPMTAHWGLPDPSRAEGTEAEKRLAFADTHRMLYQRIGVLVHLPIAALDRLVLQKSIDAIGEKVRAAAEKA